MRPDAVSDGSTELATAVRSAVARLEVVAEGRASAGRAATAGWDGPTREHFERQRSRQSAQALHLVAQGRRLATELEAR